MFHAGVRGVSELTPYNYYYLIIIKFCQSRSLIKYCISIYTLQNRRSALFYAAQKGHELLVVELINYDAMTDIKDVVNSIIIIVIIFNFVY